MAVCDAWSTTTIRPWLRRAWAAPWYSAGQFGGQFRDGYGQNVRSGAHLRAGERSAPL